MRGYCGIGIQHPKFSLNVGGLWRAAFCFGADFMFCIGEPRRKQREDTVKAARHVPLYLYADNADFLHHLPVGIELVGVEIRQDARDLRGFRHPERAAYLLGPEDGSLPEELIAHCNAIVQIATRRCLNVAQAGSIVLYDRAAKAGRTV